MTTWLERNTMRSGGYDTHATHEQAGAVEAAPVVASRTQIWGVLNVTPDSFSDGGRYYTRDAALIHAQRLLADGADVIDVGGASSRPRGTTYGAGALAVDPAEEAGRVVPVVEDLARLGVKVSVDTTSAAVARAGLAAGACIINDVSCAASPDLLEAVAAHGASYVVMHTRGQGEVAPPATSYANVCDEVLAELLAGVERAERAGIAREKLWLDPGVGFAKTAQQSAELLGALPRLIATGLPVLVGASRKGFLAQLAPRPNGELAPPLEREAGGAAVIALAVAMGAAAVRVHDVTSARQAVLVTEALTRAPRFGEEAASC